MAVNINETLPHLALSVQHEPGFSSKSPSLYHPEILKAMCGFFTYSTCVSVTETNHQSGMVIAINILWNPITHSSGLFTLEYQVHSALKKISSSEKWLGQFVNWLTSVTSCDKATSSLGWSVSATEHTLYGAALNLGMGERVLFSLPRSNNLVSSFYMGSGGNVRIQQTCVNSSFFKIKK